MGQPNDESKTEWNRSGDRLSHSSSFSVYSVCSVFKTLRLLLFVSYSSSLTLRLFAFDPIAQSVLPHGDRIARRAGGALQSQGGEDEGEFVDPVAGEVFEVEVLEVVDPVADE